MDPLSLLDHGEEAVAAGRRLLAASPDRFRPLLVLAHAHQRQYQWHDAAKLHEEALRLAHSRPREALVRHQIGRRLFDEARYREAAALTVHLLILRQTKRKNAPLPVREE